MAVKISDYVDTKGKSELEIDKNTEISDDVWDSIEEGQILSGRTGTASEGKSYRAVRFAPKNTTSEDTNENEITEITLIEITGGIEEPWEDYKDIVVNFSGTTGGNRYRPFQGYFYGSTECLNYFESRRLNSQENNINDIFNKFPNIRNQTN